MNAVEFKHISKAYSNFNIQDLSFAVPKGYITGLIGPNGAGKSTLIKILLHLAIPEQGRVFIEGMEMPQREKEIKERIGFVSDESHFYEHLTVRQTGRLLASFTGIGTRRSFKPIWSGSSFRPGRRFRTYPKA